MTKQEYEKLSPKESRAVSAIMKLTERFNQNRNLMFGETDTNMAEFGDDEVFTPSITSPDGIEQTETLEGAWKQKLEAFAQLSSEHVETVKRTLDEFNQGLEEFAAEKLESLDRIMNMESRSAHRQNHNRAFAQSDTISDDLVQTPTSEEYIPDEASGHPGDEVVDRTSQDSDGASSPVDQPQPADRVLDGYFAQIPQDMLGEALTKSLRRLPDEVLVRVPVRAVQEARMRYRDPAYPIASRPRQFNSIQRAEAEANQPKESKFSPGLSSNTFQILLTIQHLIFFLVVVVIGICAVTGIAQPVGSVIMAISVVWLLMFLGSGAAFILGEEKAEVEAEELLV